MMLRTSPESSNHSPDSDGDASNRQESTGSRGEVFVRISPAKDQAIIPKLCPALPSGQPLSMSYVIHRLEEAGVGHGILKAELQGAVEEVLKSGQTLDSVLAAKGDDAAKDWYGGFFLGLDSMPLDVSRPWMYQGKLKQRMASLEELPKHFTHRSVEQWNGSQISAYWVWPGLEVAREVLPSRDSPPKGVTDDIMYPVPEGEPRELRLGQGLEVNRETLIVRSTEHGYLALQDGELFVRNPIWVAQDGIRAYWVGLPVWNDFSKGGDVDYTGLLERAGIFAESFAGPPKSPPWGGSKALLVEAARGRDAVNGSDARLENITPGINRIGTELESGGMDYRTLGVVIDIHKDQELLIKHKAGEGTAGFDVYGKALEAAKGKDVAVQPGSHVEAFEEADRIVFKAVRDGVLFQSGDRISVEEAFSVKGDVDFSVGNIDSSVAVFVEGNVLSGFFVHSKKSVIIRGNVENGAEVRSEEDLCIQGGILGPKSKVECKGSLSVRFVQDARVVAGGNIEVEKSVLNAKLIAKGNIHVIGKGVKQKGCVFGSLLNACGDARVLSLGGNAGPPSLIAVGIDLLSREKITALESEVRKLDSLILRTSRSLGFNIHSPDAVERIRKLPAGEKSRVTTIISHIGTLTGKKGALEELIQGESAKLAPENVKAKILVERDLIPDVYLQIGARREKRSHPLYNKTFYLDTAENCIKDSDGS